MKKCVKCGKTAQDDEVYCLNCGSLLEDIAPDHSNGSKLTENADLPGQEDAGKPNIKKEKRKKIFCLVIMIGLAVCIVFLCVIAIREHSRADRYENRYWESYRKINNELNPEISSLEEQIRDLEEQNAHQAAELETRASQIAALTQQTEWMDEFIAIIDDTKDDTFYHTYSCSSLDWSGNWRIKAYNVKLAESNGYEPCPDCHSSEAQVPVPPISLSVPRGNR